MAKSITSSVGKVGNPNMAADVRAVRAMLNNVDARSGGPDPKLAVDGKIGPGLIAAILEFQDANIGTPSEKGKVTPNGETMARLNEWDDDPAFTMDTTLSCPHGGTVVVTSHAKPGGWAGSGETPIATTDKFVIEGCPYDSPCVQVKWVSSPCKWLDRRSSGLCVTASHVPQGSVVVDD